MGLCDRWRVAWGVHPTEVFVVTYKSNCCWRPQPQKKYLHTSPICCDLFALRWREKNNLLKSAKKKLYHLESRWRNSHVLVYHGPLLKHLVGVAPSTFTRVYTKKYHGKSLPGTPCSQPFINGWLSIGWFFQSLHRKWLEITKHPSIFKWLEMGFQVVLGKSLNLNGLLPTSLNLDVNLSDPRTFVAHESGAKRCVGRPSSTGAKKEIQLTCFGWDLNYVFTHRCVKT